MCTHVYQHQNLTLIVVMCMSFIHVHKREVLTIFPLYVLLAIFNTAMLGNSTFLSSLYKVHGCRIKHRHSQLLREKFPKLAQVNNDCHQIYHPICLIGSTIILSQPLWRVYIVSMVIAILSTTLYMYGIHSRAYHMWPSTYNSR